mmetsp:Transcript_67524/g.159194  ORF Transcript_67524/g.159194 Transcript_67524/m.159194 type:complete len:125 (-) Transcript_67524:17-391(-)
MLLPCSVLDSNCWNDRQLTRFASFCHNTFGAAPLGRMQTQAANWGGMMGARGWTEGVIDRVVYTNGELDPWSYAGLGHSSIPTSWVIRGSAHHADLRQPLPSDSSYLVETRERVAAQLQEWLLL